MLSNNYLQRFGGIARLYGNNALVELSQAHIAVIGLGGVGSWAAEALARTGVGNITLVELDDICITNSNRQSHALHGDIGKSKLAQTSQRLKQINPDITVHEHHDFLSLQNIPKLINQEQHAVIDAIDSVKVKAGLASYCSALKIRLIMCGSSGGKKNPQRIKVADLGNTKCDRMLAKIRHELYRTYKFSRDTKRRFRIDVIYSDEQMLYPKPDGSVCMEKSVLENGTKLDCAGGFGSSVMVTSTFGMLAASQAIERYLMRRNQGNL